LIVLGVTIGENSMIHACLYIDKDVLDNKIIKK
jgi:tetrahydrodipicolinate N-succinyltransferase